MEAAAETTARLEGILLARLLVAGEKGATAAELRKAVEPLVGHTSPGASVADRIDIAVQGLLASGLALRVRKGRTSRDFATQAGLVRAREWLGLREVPPKLTWDRLRKTYLAAKALGLPAPEGDEARRFAGDNGFKAALLKARFGLPVADHPRKIEEAIDALAWSLLGLPGGRKFDVKTVQAALLRRALGDDRPEGPRPDPKKEVARLLAREVGARQSGKDELRLAALRRWVDGQPLVPAPGVGLDLEAFAATVLDAARACRTGRFGADKVFVSHVWRALAGDRAVAGLDLDGFKARLGEANAARLLDLSRADLVEAMEASDVAESEVPSRGATYHFIRTPTDPR